MNAHLSNDELLDTFLSGETGAELCDELARRAAADEGFADRLSEELRFSESLRQVLGDGADDLPTRFLGDLESASLSAEELADRVGEGAATRFEGDRLARHLWQDPAAAAGMRRRLALDEMLRLALVESKDEDAFLASLETRMWAETGKDRFVDDFAKRLDREIPVEEEVPEGRIVAFPTLGTFARMAAAAAVVAFGAYFAAQSLALRTNRTRTPAEIVKATPDAAWSHGAAPRLEERLAPGVYELKSGVVSMRLADGGELTVQGPARFEVGEDASASLHAGLALARAPMGEGRVKVRARGLSFTEPARFVGIDARSEGATEAVVFEGIGGICLGDPSICRDLSEFEAVKADHLRGRLVDVPYNPRAFSKAWSLASGVEDNLGRVRIELPGSVLAAIGAEAGEVRVFVENEAFRLDVELEVDRVVVGEFALAEPNPGQSLEAAGKLRSYLVELPPTGAGEVETSLTFDHPVVGVIFSDERLEGSDAAVGARLAESGGALRRGLASGEDEILLSEDRRTLNLRLRGGGDRLEQVRVLVALN